MDRDLVTRLAQSCGITLGKESVLTTEELCCFASLIAEECANVCETLAGVQDCEEAIRSKFGIQQ